MPRKFKRLIWIDSGSHFKSFFLFQASQTINSKHFTFVDCDTGSTDTTLIRWKSIQCYATQTCFWFVHPWRIVYSRTLVVRAQKTTGDVPTLCCAAHYKAVSIETNGTKEHESLKIALFRKTSRFFFRYSNCWSLQQPASSYNNIREEYMRERAGQSKNLQKNDDWFGRDTAINTTVRRLTIKSTKRVDTSQH